MAIFCRLRAYHRVRRIFGKWAEVKTARDPCFQHKILFSNDAHFWLNGYVTSKIAVFVV